MNMDFIMVPLVLFIIGETIYRIFQLYATRRERILFIEKMNEIPADAAETCARRLQSQRSLLNFQSSGIGRFTSLRWALALMGIGLGMLAGILIDVALNPRILDQWDFTDGIYGVIFAASMFLFGGLGLVISYIVENRQSRSSGSSKE